MRWVSPLSFPLQALLQWFAVYGKAQGVHSCLVLMSVPPAGQEPRLGLLPCCSRIYPQEHLVSYSWATEPPKPHFFTFLLGLNTATGARFAVLVPRSFPTSWILSFHVCYPCFSHLLLSVTCAVHAQLCQTKHFIFRKMILKPSLVSSPLNRILFSKEDTTNDDLGMKKSHEGRQKLCFPGE